MKIESQLEPQEPLKNNVSLKMIKELKIANFLITFLQIFRHSNEYLSYCNSQFTIVVKLK